jgi:hypothetical protein
LDVIDDASFIFAAPVDFDPRLAYQGTAASTAAQDSLAVHLVL